jgi:hypothetical protein
MSGSQQSGNLSCGQNSLREDLFVIPAGDSATSAEAAAKILGGMTEKSLDESVFLVGELLEGRFPGGIFCDPERSQRARKVGWRNWS